MSIQARGTLVFFSLRLDLPSSPWFIDKEAMEALCIFLLYSRPRGRGWRLEREPKQLSKCAASAP